MKIATLQQLRELYNQPSERATQKELTAIDIHAASFIERSPFCLLATTNTTGQMDVSPRGGNAGFVKINNATEIVIPDAKGNNRLDSLSNIIETGKVGMLFLIPGMDETLRLNGSAYVTKDETILNQFSSENKLPVTCIVIKVEEIFLHCAKALMRSKFWALESQIERSEMPTLGQMLKDQMGSKESPESQESMVARYLKDL